MVTGFFPTGSASFDGWNTKRIGRHKAVIYCCSCSQYCQAKQHLLKNNTCALTVILGNCSWRPWDKLCPLHTLKRNETSRKGMCHDSSVACVASGAYRECKGVCWCYQAALKSLSVGFCQSTFARGALMNLLIGKKNTALDSSFFSVFWEEAHWKGKCKADET